MIHYNVLRHQSQSKKLVFIYSSNILTEPIQSVHVIQPEALITVSLYKSD
ncbi:hypothetical protein EMUR_00325 [Ehrlichia muris AS145]|uniref:Uncharacterized protein n=1 Tax=Ehrlichia muris AS145 TaxID=1423892 RepID=V9R765_9RICK|nr:hypothetical protein EMUR_00325 [Ehrlichia muris AS145]